MWKLLTLLILLPSVAFAQDATHVVLPWGDWTIRALDTLQPVVTFALTSIASYVMAAYLPPWMKALAGAAAQKRLNEVLENAVKSAVAQTKGAVTGQRVSIPVGKEIIAKAIQYAVNIAPDLIKSMTGDQLDNLIKMVMARMEQLGVAPRNLDADAVGKAMKKEFKFEDAISKGLGGK